MTSSVSYRGRFAPSPTGPLHLGSLYVAFGSWLLARKANGKWLIRIEDLDPPREIEGAADDQVNTLAAFGLVSDEPVIRQSQRHDLYQTALDALLASGHAFFCHCSRTDLTPHRGIHRGCVAQASRATPSIRLRIADGDSVVLTDQLQGRYQQNVRDEIGDFVIKRADGFWAYQFAVVIDDADQRITDIVRGNDLFDSSPRQILLQRALGLPTPRYAHLPLLVDHSGIKLSKSSLAPPIDPDDPLPSLRTVWRYLGQPPHLLDDADSVEHALRDAVFHFDPARLPRVARITLD